MYYCATNKQFEVETALLQFLSNLDYKSAFVYWTIINTGIFSHVVGLE